MKINEGWMFKVSGNWTCSFKVLCVFYMFVNTNLRFGDFQRPLRCWKGNSVLCLCDVSKCRLFWHQYNQSIIHNPKTKTNSKASTINKPHYIKRGLRYFSGNKSLMFDFPFDWLIDQYTNSFTSTLCHLGEQLKVFFIVSDSLRNW